MKMKITALAAILAAFAGNALADDFATALPQRDAVPYSTSETARVSGAPWTIGEYVAVRQAELAPVTRQTVRKGVRTARSPSASQLVPPVWRQ